MFRVVACLVLIPRLLGAAGVIVTPDVEFVRAGGKPLKMDVYQPAAGQGNRKALRPAVLCIHGGGWEAGNRRQMGKIARYFAGHGYVAFCPSYRLVTDSRNKWPAQLDDVQAAVRWVRHSAGKYGVDGGRVAAVGVSAGGHLAALLGNLETRNHADPRLRAYSSRVDVVVSVAGPADLTRDFRHLKYTGGRSVQDVVDKLLGKNQAKKARAASPVFRINPETVPHMLVHGAEDRVVPVQQSRDYRNALLKAGVTCRYIELPKVGHGIRNPVVIWVTMARVRRFVDAQMELLEKQARVPELR